LNLKINYIAVKISGRCAEKNDIFDQIDQELSGRAHYSQVPIVMPAPWERGLLRGGRRTVFRSLRMLPPLMVLSARMALPKRAKHDETVLSPLCDRESSIPTEAGHFTAADKY